jgi:predicted nucleic-acid-binding protein
MKKPPAIDANIILRFLTNDDPEKADACARLLLQLEKNEVSLWLPDLVLADIIWTLEKFYRVKKTEISELLSPILKLRGLHCSNKEIIFSALRIYTGRNIDWTDSFVAAQMLADRTETIYSYDLDFERVPGIIRVEP